MHLARDYAAVDNPKLAGWRVVSQPTGPAQLVTAPGPQETRETGLLLESIAVVSGMASRLNQLLGAAGAT